MPNQPVTSKPGTSVASAGASGNSGDLPASPMASSRSAPSCTWREMSARLVIMKSVAAAEDIDHRRRCPAIGHMGHGDAGLLRQQLARKVLGGADAGAAEDDGARARGGQHIRHAAVRAIAGDDEAIGGERDIADRRQRLAGVERQVGALELRRDRHGAHRALVDGIAIGRAAGDLGGADDAVHPGAVLDHGAGAEDRADGFGDQPGDEVRGAAGGEAADDPDGAVLRRRPAGPGRARPAAAASVFGASSLSSRLRAASGPLWRPVKRRRPGWTPDGFGWRMRPASNDRSMGAPQGDAAAGSGNARPCVVAT